MDCFGPKLVEKLSEHTKRLAVLKVGDHVRVQNQTGNAPRKWDRTGVVVEVRQFDQYVIKVHGSGRVTLRNRKFLRKYTPFAPTTINPAQFEGVTSTPVSPYPISQPSPTTTPAVSADVTKTPAPHTDPNMDTENTNDLQQHAPPPNDCLVPSTPLVTPSTPVKNHTSPSPRSSVVKPRSILKPRSPAVHTNTDTELPRSSRTSRGRLPTKLDGFEVTFK